MERGREERRAVPKQLCKGRAGCPGLVDRGVCEDCRAKGWAKEARPSASARLYDGRWRKKSKAYLQRHPLCADPRGIHREARQVVAAKEVDHIEPHGGDETLFWDEDNWQGLCKHCHSVKTATEDGGFGRSNVRAQSGADVRAC